MVSASDLIAHIKNMSEAIALLKTALALLILLQSATNVPASLHDQAKAVAEQAIRSANDAIAAAQIAPSPVTSPTTNASAQQSSPSAAPSQVATSAIPTPTSQARIDIVNYTTDLTKQYTAMPESCKLIIGSNYNDVDCRPSAYPDNGDVTLKAVLYNDDGSVNQSAVMQITATDARQNKTFNGTGNVVTFYEDGQKQQVYGYVFGYHFLSPGSHAITFSANEVSKTVTLTAN